MVYRSSKVWSMQNDWEPITCQSGLTQLSQKVYYWLFIINTTTIEFDFVANVLKTSWSLFPIMCAKLIVNACRARPAHDNPSGPGYTCERRAICWCDNTSLLTGWGGWMGNCLAWGHDFRNQCSMIPAKLPRAKIIFPSRPIQLSQQVFYHTIFIEVDFDRINCW